MRDADWSSGSDVVARWLDVFRAFGWLELGEMQAGGQRRAVWRWRPLAAENRTELVVQPDGELLAGPYCGYDVRWELELMSDRLRDEQLTVYVISAASVARAVEQGRTRASLAAFLTTAGGLQELPPTVGAMLDEWTKRAGRYAFAETTVLRCDTEALADWAADHPAIAPLLIERIGPLYYAVDSASVSEIRRELAKAGYPARRGMPTLFRTQDSGAAGGAYAMAARKAGGGDAAMQAGKGDDAAAVRKASAKAPSGRAERAGDTAGTFLYEAAPLRHYELDSPDDGGVGERMRSELRALPQMWLQQLRAYHLSTRKELMQKAMALETSVQIRMDGELRLFIPEALEQRAGQWTVTGRLIGDDGAKPGRLTPEMWEEMKLVVPAGLAT